LKIQDGCNNFCAYCRVPFARGNSVSLESSEVLRRLKILEEKGYAEAVLTGVNIGNYCHDEARSLGGLLLYLLENTSAIALRLSSIPPEKKLIGEAFIEAAKSGRARPHFHLSLQSGSDNILGMMGRRYGSSEAEECAARLRDCRGDPFLACDVIAGFPGETEKDFEDTYRFCKNLDFAWIHVFPFSPRPGTAAFKMRPRVSERDAVFRVARLTELAKEGRARYVERWLGKTVAAAPLTGNAVLTDNYLKVRLCGESSGKSEVRCTLVRALPGTEFDAEGYLV
jgi:threonylcarbamoyladenosine tRNA methylthiotransferase MtaB